MVRPEEKLSSCWIHKCEIVAVLQGLGMEQECCWLPSVPRIFTNLVSTTVAFGDTYLHNVPSAPQSDVPSVLQHTCHAVSFAISNREMPNEGRLCCQQMSERLGPVGRIRFLDGYFQWLT
jgi:hypothetical protein